MAFLVTGGTGYIGSYVVRDILDQNKNLDKVVCLQRSGITPVAREVVGDDRLKRVKVVQGDVSDAVQLFEVIKENHIDVAVHIAYLVPPTSENQPAYALRVNCGGMSNILEAARLFGLKKVVWTSSSNALGRVFEFYKEPIGDDDAIYRPDIMYGATKGLNEFMARLYFQKFGVDSIGFRLPRTYGIGRWHGHAQVFMDFLRNAALNTPTSIDDYDLKKAYLYVEDASSIIARACVHSTTKTRVFNIAEGEYSNREVVQAIRRINPGARIKLNKPKPGVVEGYVLPPVKTSGVRKELGWRAKYSLEDGLKRTLNYFRQQEGKPLF